jgi:hypothetical protein
LEEDSAHAHELARTQETLTLAADVIATGKKIPRSSFDYLFLNLVNDPAAHLPSGDAASVVAALNALGDAMVEERAQEGGELQPTGNSSIPPVYTYWGQFIDHDLTANTDRKSPVSDITIPGLSPLDPAFIVANLENLRQPTVNLDSLYGDGPTFDAGSPTQARSFYDGVRFKLGTAATKTPEGEDIPGERIPPVDDLERDLPRVNKVAQIADARNDENLIVAQLHVAFLRFHNAVVDWVEANESGDIKNEKQLFERARLLTIWHYQWLVVHDYLKTVTLAGITDKVLLGGPKYYAPRNGEPFMPLEFSVAAYRFGHTMVRGAYDYNRNFGRPDAIIAHDPLENHATFELLFQFTGNGFPSPFMGVADVLPFNWIIEWDRFVDKGSSIPDHFARRIDTMLAPPLAEMINEGNDTPDEMIRMILKRLARRNLLRGYQLSIPTGQSVARELGVKPLSEGELRQGNSDALNRVLEENGFLELTPLWFYVLKEAEVRANGNTLGEVGSRIVCESIIGQLIHDPESYLNAKDEWNPSDGVRLPGGDLIVTIGDLFRFAGISA